MSHRAEMYAVMVLGGIPRQADRQRIIHELPTGCFVSG
jgi:hypothetical protein